MAGGIHAHGLTPWIDDAQAIEQRLAADAGVALIGQPARGHGQPRGGVRQQRSDVHRRGKQGRQHRCMSFACGEDDSVWSRGMGANSGQGLTGAHAGRRWRCGAGECIAIGWQLNWQLLQARGQHQGHTCEGGQLMPDAELLAEARAQLACQAAGHFVDLGRRDRPQLANGGFVGRAGRECARHEAWHQVRTEVQGTRHRAL